MKVSYALLTSLAIAACSTGTTVSNPGNGVTSDIAKPASLEGMAYTGAFAGTNTDGTPGAGWVGGALVFDNAGGVDLMDSTGMVVIDHAVWDANLKAYVGTNGYTLYAYRDPNKPSILIFKGFYDDPSSTYTQVGYMANGDLTPGANMPIAGSATYNGGVEVTDHNAAIADGTIKLTANFGTGMVGGNLSIQAGTVLGAADFALVQTPIVPQAGDTYFVTTLTTSDVTLNNSSIHGEFMGTQGQEVGGELTINAVEGSVAGAFSAQQ